MKDLELNIRRVNTREESLSCAEIMAGSEPWITLGMDRDHVVNTFNDPLNEVYAAYIKDEIVGTMIVQTKGAFSGYLKSIAVKPDWRGKKLVAHIKTCTANEIRIPFIVGDDHSRTWILRRVEAGLQFQHDHRHADGMPDDVTLYGGTTLSSGSHLAQSFPADDYTADLIPEAATNEWFLSFSEDGTELTYYLERHGKPRFRAILEKN